MTALLPGETVQLKADEEGLCSETAWISALPQKLQNLISVEREFQQFQDFLPIRIAFILRGLLQVLISPNLVSPLGSFHSFLGLNSIADILISVVPIFYTILDLAL